jgi:hypothetical protein
MQRNNIGIESSAAELGNLDIKLVSKEALRSGAGLRKSYKLSSMQPAV